MKVKSQSFVKNLIFQLSICFLVTIFVEFKYCQNRTVHCTVYMLDLTFTGPHTGPNVTYFALHPISNPLTK